MSLPNCLAKWLYHFVLPPAMCEHFCCSTSCRHLMLSVFWVLVVLEGLQWYFIVLIFGSLMIYDIKHLSISFCSICISSLVRYRCPLGFSVFLLLSVKRFFYILNNVLFLSLLQKFLLSLWSVTCLKSMYLFVCLSDLSTYHLSIYLSIYLSMYHLSIWFQSLTWQRKHCVIISAGFRLVGLL
jgi:hypothetical protein